ncbi:hypothetical protein J2Y45_000400 [Dyadobacter sp. BE34]|uniref:Uncharacterized protein n=1 Tax=Dyadobacter fermentans TaxID=94254 RepID=A0ABU1QPR0_9BACT|nr:hypothetical protein [Dyadobacter fermentans]MDR7040872.1 hypothetical protein [Dyadobacter sp. BE242]MDR7195274.1 hypothetical protein [Dyadobacter sp. BE34]MDR7214180.1 hypothetical protein [Dyadobacter sp. BE31]MDR7260682.1 hypothetical protein [Dyadobacter sp. BE32]
MLFGILEKDGIKAVTRQNYEGMLYGITYIDHRTWCVFNGSALGKQYSPNGILDQKSRRGYPIAVSITSLPSSS